MSKTFTLRVILVISIILLHNEISLANKVDETLAKIIAKNFYNQRASKQSSDFILAYTKKTSDNTPLYFVFNVNQKDGFVMVSGDDAAYPILAYNLTGHYDTSNLAPEFKYWIKSYEKQLLYIIKNSLSPSARNASKWNNLVSSRSTEITSIIISPLVKTTWGQDVDGITGNIDYNNYCPPFNTNPHSPTGCVATAMAQIMKYWNYPLHGIGSHSYTDDGILNPPSYGIQYADFGNETYDWCSMPNNSSSTAVAVLMRHCGVSVDMDYGPSNSISALAPLSIYPTAYSAYKTYFGYNSITIDYFNRSAWSDAVWITKLKNELNNGRPIQYGGQDENNQGGHSWVCDGYDSNDMFHMNWGFGNGTGTWVYISDIILVDGPKTYHFNDGQQIITGIQPPSKPDIVPLSPQVLPFTITPGSQTVVSTYIKNQGTGISNNSNIAIWLSKDQIFNQTPNGTPADVNLNADISAPSLTAGQVSVQLSKSITIPSGTAIGNWYIMLGADATDCNTESSESNNQVFVQITVASAPICTAPTVTTHPTNKTVTVPNSTSFSISASGSDNSYQWQFNTGSGWANVVNSAIYSGAYSTTLSISSTYVSMSGYQYRCKISSSCTSVTATSNTATLTVNASSAACNNDLSCQPKPITIYPSCVVTSCTTVGATPPAPTVGFTSCAGVPYQAGRYDDDVWFSFTATNTNPVTIKVTPTSNLSNFDPVIGLYSGNCSTPTQLSGGCADVNPSGGIEQLVYTPVVGTTYLIRVFGYYIGSSTSGNFDICATAQGVVTTMPDLEIDNVSVSSLEICTGGSFQVEYDVENNGGASAGSSTVKYYLSSNSTYSTNDVSFGSGTSVSSISSGNKISKSKSLNIPAGTANGSWYVLIIADFDNDVTEGNSGESNNVYSRQISVTSCSLADIRITYTGTPPTSGAVGSNVPVSYGCTNIGGTITPSTRVGFYFSTDNIFDPITDIYLDDNATNSLDPGETDDDATGISLPNCLLCGNYFIIMVADYQNLVSESNRANNIYTFPFTTTGCVACSISIPSTGMSFQSAGGDGSISVTTTECCTWSATTTTPWINITLNSGTGAGAVNYTVSSCSGGGTRAGTILVNGQSYPVTQNCTESCNASNTFTWAAKAGSSTHGDAAEDLAMDASGNLYMTGDIQGSASFGNGIVLTTPSTAPDVFVSKHNSLGQIQWAVRYGNTSQEEGTGIVTDNAGNIYVIGEFGTTITFGSITLTSPNGAAFLLKLNSSGAVQWAVKIENYIGANDIFINNGNDIFITGNYSNGSEQLYIAKYNTSGIQLWFKFYGGNGSNFKSSYGINTDNIGNIYIVGQYNGEVTFGTYILNSTQSDFDGFTTKLDANGNVIWANKLTSLGQGSDELRSVAVDGLNNIYVVGNVDSTAIVGNITIPLPDKNSKEIIIKYDQNGNPLWAKASTLGYQYNKHTIIRGNDNDMYIAGCYSNAMKIDSFMIAGFGSNDAFVMRIDENAKIKWLKGIGGTEYDDAGGMVMNSANDIFIAGEFEGSVSFSSQTITSNGRTDIFLAKLKQCDPPLANVTYTGNLVLCQGQTLALSTSYCSTNSYQWQLNGLPILGANNPSYTATQPGSYKVKVIAFAGCETVSDSIVIKSDGIYTFTGTGNWNIASNWNNNAVPPTVLPSCYEIIINPQVGGECILNVPQTIAQGKIRVVSGKKFRVLGNLTIQ